MSYRASGCVDGDYDLPAHERPCGGRDPFGAHWIWLDAENRNQADADATPTPKPKW
jgi:hypothetical protein